MIETKEKIIDGCTYSVTQMTARRALKLQTRLVKLLGTSLVHMLTLNDTNEESELVYFDENSLVKAVESLSSELKESDFENLILEILNGVRKDGVELSSSVIDLEFAGRLDTIFKVVFFVLEVNFSSFFGEGGISNLLKEKTPKTKASLKRD